MLPLANSRSIPHAPLSANAAVVEHGVGATETTVDVAVGDVEVAGAVSHFCIFV